MMSYLFTVCGWYLEGRCHFFTIYGPHLHRWATFLPYLVPNEVPFYHIWQMLVWPKRNDSFWSIWSKFVAIPVKISSCLGFRESFFFFWASLANLGSRRDSLTELPFYHIWHGWYSGATFLPYLAWMVQGCYLFTVFGTIGMGRHLFTICGTTGGSLPSYHIWSSCHIW